MQTPEYKQKLDAVQSMHNIVLNLNNEDAYASWIYDMPDSPTEEDFKWFAAEENATAFDELSQKFVNLLSQYLADGLCVANKTYTPDGIWL